MSKGHVSHTDKKMKRLESQVEENKHTSRRSLIIGFVTLGLFIIIIAVEHNLAIAGYFGDKRMAIDGITLCVLIVVAVISVRFFGKYSSGSREYKESLFNLEHYKNNQNK